MEDQRRRLALVRVEDRRPLRVRTVRVGRVALQEERVELADVRRVVEARPVGDDRERDRRREAVGLRHRPRRHEAAVAAAGDRDARVVDDAVGDERVDAGEDVLAVAAAHVAEVRARELLAAAARAARVRQEDARTPSCSDHLHQQRREAPRPGRRRAAVDVHDAAAARRSRARAGSASRPSISEAVERLPRVRRASRRCAAARRARRSATSAPAARRRPRGATISGGAVADSKTAATLEPSGCGDTRGWNRAPSRTSPATSSSVDAVEPQPAAHRCRRRASPRTRACPRPRSRST